MNCLNCGKIISQKKKFCNNKCQKEYQYLNYINKWKKGEVNGLRGIYQTSSYIKTYLFIKYNNKCARCGWGEINPYTGNIPLEIEHIDGNYLNNKEDNLTKEQIKMVENLEKNIANKVAIVTGGAKGIGASIVKKLAQNGYNVILNYNKSESQAKAIENEFSNVYIFKANVSNYEEVKSLVDFTINKFGKIDLLVNNAGIDLVKTINDTSIEDFDNILKNNLYSAFYTSKEVSKYMINSKAGKIINISSIWGIIGASCEMAYSVSKAGVDAMTKSLAKELGPSNIQVNSIAPGIIDTDMNKFLSEEEKKQIIEEIPLEHIGKTEDIAETVLFLSNSDYITGQVVQVNGGWNV